MKKFNKFLGLFKEIQQTPHHPELTDFLSKNKHFQKMCYGIHEFPSYLLRKLDEAAFPENYEQEKKYLKGPKDFSRKK